MTRCVWLVVSVREMTRKKRKSNGRLEGTNQTRHLKGSVYKWMLRLSVMCTSSEVLDAACEAGLVVDTTFLGRIRRT